MACTVRGLYFAWLVLCVACTVPGLYCAWLVLCVACTVRGLYCTWLLLYVAWTVRGSHCTWFVLYVVRTVRGLNCTWLVLYVACTVHGFYCTWLVLCVAWTVRGLYCTWLVLYVVRTVSGLYCTWFVLYVVRTLRGLYCTWFQSVSCSSCCSEQWGLRCTIHFYSKINKLHQCIKFNLLWNDTLHVSDGLSVHHQEFNTVHTATGICQTGTAVCRVLNCWWWTERPSETCTVSFQNKINLRHWCINVRRNERTTGR